MGFTGINTLIDRYIHILEQGGEPDEAYKYGAIDTFQENWNIDAEDFYQMFRNSFSRKENLLFHNSWGFIDKSAQKFPEETRQMFRNLYDESIEIRQRLSDFQKKSEELLLKVREKLNKVNINAQQDERTLSVYLAFRYPDKYILYKWEYYQKYCKEFGVTIQEVGSRFLHLQLLADKMIQYNYLNHQELQDLYRSFYPKPDWDDKYLIIQNILYVSYRIDLGNEELLEFLKKFDRKELEEYYGFLDKIIERFDLHQGDQRLVFNFTNKIIVLTIGQRYILYVKQAKSTDYKFRVISEYPICDDFINFDGSPKAYLNRVKDFEAIKSNQNSILNAIEKELNRTQISGYSKHNKKELEQMAFDIDFRNEMLNQLEYSIINKNPMKDTNTENNRIPLNQILFGAPGTGKTYNTKRIAVEIINGKKERTREEINKEYQELVNSNQIVFTTFHQSLSYEDFIEGIKPTIFEDNDESKSVIYEIKNGIFKELCQKAQIQSKVTKNETEVYDFDNAWNDLMEEANSFLQNEQTFELPILTLNKGLFITEITNQGNLKLKPKSSDTALEYTVSYNRTKKLQEAFPDLSLIKNIDKEFRSVIGGSNSTAYWSVLNYINSKIYSNQKTKAVEILLPPKRHVLIIDEINRGNVSAVFGELITLLEEDKRKGNAEAVEVTLPYSKTAFSVPNNVYIIGTMNTADRSVEALDTALRRRFSFVEMQPNPNVLENSEYQNVDLKKLLETINERIELLIDKDHQIGHSYFIGIKNSDDLKLVFKDKIIPLLEEYFYGDFGKIGLVLGGGFISQKENTAKFPEKFSYENDFLEDKKVYRFTPFESWDEQTLISVYENE